MNGVNVYLGRQRKREERGPRSKECAFPCSVCPSAGVPDIWEAENLPLVVDPSPHFVDIEVIHMIK